LASILPKTYLLPVNKIHFAIVVYLSSEFLLGMLVWRIWRIERLIDKNTSYPDGRQTTQPRPIQKFMRAIAESGAVYTTTVFATFLASASGSNAALITAGLASISTCISNSS
jgi:hypothetical protein